MTSFDGQIAIHPIIRQIIDRDCHVAESNRKVIRHVISKLRNGMQTFQAMPRDDRRELMQQCIERHRQNREMYAAVMGGWSSVGMTPPQFRKEDTK